MLRGLRLITLALIALVLMSTEALAIGGYCVSMNTTSCKFCGSLANCRAIFGTAPTFRCTSSAATKCYKCSVNVEGLLGGLGNVSKGPNANPVAYRVTMFIQDAEVSCINPGGNAERANGQPFFTTAVPLSATDVINSPKQVTKNGRALADVLFEDSDIINGLIAGGAFDGTNITSLADVCPNAGWTARVLVKQMQVLGQVFDNSENSPTCGQLVQVGDESVPRLFHDPRTSYAVVNDGCNLTDALTVQCYAPTGAIVDTNFTYVGGSFDGAPPCETTCSNRLAEQNSSVLACDDPTATPLPPQ
jgi:hypothetical protein